MEIKTIQQAREYLARNKDYLSYRAIANAVGMNVSNFHQFVKNYEGEKGIKQDTFQKLLLILQQLTCDRPNIIT